MNKWVLLQPGDLIPALKDDDFILLAMSGGGILRVMFRFVKNIRGSIAGYLINDQETISAHNICREQLGFMAPHLSRRFNTIHRNKYHAPCSKELRLPYASIASMSAARN